MVFGLLTYSLDTEPINHLNVKLYFGEKNLVRSNYFFQPIQCTKNIIFTKISFYLQTLLAIDSEGDVYFAGIDRTKLAGTFGITPFKNMAKLDIGGIKFLDVCQKELYSLLIDINNNLWVSKYDGVKTLPLSFFMENVYKVVASYDGVDDFYIMLTDRSVYRIDSQLNVEHIPELDFLQRFPGESIQRKSLRTKSAIK